MHLADLVFDLGDVFFFFFSFGLLVGDGLAVYEADGGAEDDAAAAGPGGVGAFDGDWDCGGFGLAGDQVEAAFELMDFAVERAGAFGEDDDSAVLLDAADERADGCQVAAAFFDGEGIEGADEAAKAGVIEERLAGHEIALAVQGHAAERGVQEALVVADKED